MTELRDFGQKAHRCKGEPSKGKGRINPRLETTGQKTGEREGAKQTRARRTRRRAHAARHKTTARRARRCAHSGELQHGVVPYSTRATHMPQQGTHGAVRTPRSYNTAQYSALRGTYQHGAHCAHSAHGAGRTRGSYSTAGCASVKGQCAHKTEHIRTQSN